MNDYTKYNYKLVKTPMGWLGFAWTSIGIIRLQLPEKNKAQTKERLCLSLDKPQESQLLPTWFKNFEQQLELYFAGEKISFAHIPLDIRATSFQQKVYNELRKVKHGQVLTYKDLAIKIGSEKASRAIGMAMGKNPVPLIIPCHRVIATSSKTLGGFSAYGGAQTKLKLLTLESALPADRSY